MGDRSAIQWTDATWNPIVGCSVVSPGCTNCYAMKQAVRLQGLPHYAGTVAPSKGGPVWTGKVGLAPDSIPLKPLTWRKPRRIFVNSMGDLFHESVPDEWIDRVFAIMALAPQHIFQVLTKRSARMREYCSDVGDYGTKREVAIRLAAMRLVGDRGYDRGAFLKLPLPNVWLGVSAEDQRRADERVPDLLATPAAVRFVSAEPLLGPIDFRWALGKPIEIAAGFLARGQFAPGLERLRRLDQIIVGGESGRRARPMHPDWARSIRDQCAAAGVAFFFKQWGEFIDYRLTGACSWHNRTPQRPTYSGPTRGIIRFPDGHTIGPLATAFSGSKIFVGLGKARAGRLLDGVEHNGMPGGPA